MCQDDIPEFLRLTRAERAAAWRDRKLTTVRTSTKRTRWHLPKTIDATGMALYRAQEKVAREKKKMRLKALKNKH